MSTTVALALYAAACVAFLVVAVHRRWNATAVLFGLAGLVLLATVLLAGAW